MKSRHSKEFEEFCSRVADAVAAATAGLSVAGPSDLKADYRSAIRFVFSLLSVFIMESRDIPGAASCCDRLRTVIQGEGNWSAALHELSSLGKATGTDILKSGGGHAISAKYAKAVLRSLLSSGDPALSSVYFSTVPAGWISLLYEYLLDRRAEPTEDVPGIRLKADSSSRKRNGAFFTPGYIVDYIVRESLGRTKSADGARVLDPAMGAGDFLISAVRHLVSSGVDAAVAADSCVFGCDIDPIAVDIARFLVWLESGGRADANAVARHLICADAIASDGPFVWDKAFPDAFGLFSGGSGFDAVIGNPPYVAAKNVALGGYHAAHGVRGQTDYYLIFLESVIQNNLVRPGGSLAMVLPDPFLVRANAASVRRSLVEKWTIRSVVHVAGAFPGAQVANIILVASNRPPDGTAFPVVRLENSPDRRSFELDAGLVLSRRGKRIRPSFVLAQPRAEVLYLVDDLYRPTFEKLHGRESSLSKVVPPFAPLEELDIVSHIFRGEEIGKRKIAASSGDMPVLLGGESVLAGGVRWEGLKIAKDSVHKPLEWYSTPKILVRKSSARVVAAYDEQGYVVPQSVYGINIGEGKYDPLYLLAILNSAFISGYVFRSFTGYKMVQPQIEIEDVRRLPVPVVNFDANPVERATFAREAIQTFEVELRGDRGTFRGLRGLVARLIKMDHTDSVHDLLVHITRTACSIDESDEFLASGADRLDRAANIAVDALYLGLR